MRAHRFSIDRILQTIRVGLCRAHAFIFVAFGLLVSHHSLQTQLQAQYDNLSLEELVNKPVIATSKESGRLFDAATSAFVFDEEAIQYLPVDSIPELLRYAPGMNVQRSSNGIWGVGIRGTNIRYFSRSTFNVDEQNLYGGIFAGLFGSQHNIPMDDISSIEVVYGSGGSVWSTNAVNGMINVILKSAFETEDTLLKTQIGSRNRNFLARTGWAVSDRTSARVYASYGIREPGDSWAFEDNWETSRVGFQSDTRFSSQDLFTISAEAYTSSLDEFRVGGNRTTGNIDDISSTEEQKGYNAQLKWTHQDGPSQGFSIRTWAGYSDFSANTVDFDFSIAGLEMKGKTSWVENHELYFSLSGNFNQIDFAPHELSKFSENADSTVFQGSASLQYEYKVIPSKVTLSAGLSTQYDSSSENLHWMPSLSAIYHINQNSRIWASYSKVYRNIPQAFRDAEYLEFMSMPIEPTAIPTPMGVLTVDRAFIYARSTDNLTDEQMDTFELGYREMFGDRTELKINTFYSKYKDAISVISGLSAPELGMGTEHLYFTQYLDLYNAAEATSWGGEISLNTHFSSGTSLLINYAYLKEESEFYSNFSNLPNSMAIETLGISPEHQASAWISQEWTPAFRTDLGLHYSGSYSNLLGKQEPITGMDFRITWKPREHIKASIVGRNLLDNDYNQMVHRDLLTFPTLQGREWYLEIKWEF